MSTHDIVFELYFNRNERKEGKPLLFRELTTSIQNREDIGLFKYTKSIFSWKNVIDIFSWRNNRVLWV